MLPSKHKPRPQRSALPTVHFAYSHSFTLLPACLYQDQWALPVNLQSSKLVWNPLFLLLSLSLFNLQSFKANGVWMLQCVHWPGDELAIRGKPLRFPATAEIIHCSSKLADRSGAQPAGGKTGPAFSQMLTSIYCTDQRLQLHFPILQLAFQLLALDA